jgi:hypothetical protein
MLNETSSNVIKWSDENIIDLIRKVRNDLIKDFLDERFLIEYLATSYRMKDLSRIKVEMIRNDLKDLLIHPVNKIHYESLIRQIRDTDSASISAGNEDLFYKEVDLILRKYIY